MLKLIQTQYHKYHAFVEAQIKTICSNGGHAILLHSYAPKSVGISSVDHEIVQKLHWAYSQERYDTWPIRPEVDVICKDTEGTVLVNKLWLDSLVQQCRSLGLNTAEGESYPLHPITMAHHYWQKYPNNILCLEIRRDLLVDNFTPFSEMSGNPNKMDEIARVIANTIPA